jgi:predicted transcriptional regulator
MATTSLTTQLDEDLAVELEQIARFDKKSVAFMTNQAIRNLVEERRATRELIATGLELIDRQATGVSSEAVHEWLVSTETAPFPGT